MAGGRIRRAKSGCLVVLDGHTTKDDFVGIVRFTDKVRFEWWRCACSVCILFSRVVIVTSQRRGTTRGQKRRSLAFVCGGASDGWTDSVL
jgi:hypothetical protein